MELLLNDILDSDIKVQFICQSGGNKRGFRGKILEKAFADIAKEEVWSCDIIINTFISFPEQVEYLYQHYKNYNKVISLYDIVSELYYYEKDVGFMLRVANKIAHTGRKIFIFDYPALKNQKIRSKRENMLLKKGLNFTKLQELLQNKELDNQMKEILMPSMNKARKAEGYLEITYEEFKKCYPNITQETTPHARYVGNSVILYDMDTPYIHVQNGMRVNFFGPNGGLHSQCTKIHFFGKSWVFGLHCSDQFTLPSLVQKIFNEKGLDFLIYNHAIPGINEDLLVNLIDEWDRRTPKDEIFVLVHMFADYGKIYNRKAVDECEYINRLSSDRPHDYGEIWVDMAHIGEDGSKLLAEQIVDGILGKGKMVPGVFRNKFNPSAGRKLFQYDIEDQVDLWSEMPEFKKYQTYISDYRQKTGAIVMNCNPFTLGHRYLIETAAKQCDKLYIFVVEEDKSIFPFKERMQLVQTGVADLENVTVLQSGKFIISAMTFPGYFSKSENNHVSVDTSDDLILFARHIAPTLGITVRYAGEEPIDFITKQYNETMKEILPKYGIEFIEIPRKTVENNVISASRVRKLLNEGNLEEIKKIVPASTFDYLVENQGKYVGK